MPNNILITGMPQSGKSTLLKKLIATVPHKVGCIVLEERQNGERVGFDIITHTGKTARLADVNHKTDIQVSKYFVDVPALESVLPDIQNFSKKDILYIDEIGQMQMHSKKFKEMIHTYLDAHNICIALVSKIYEDNFIASVKNRPDVSIYEITLKNRNNMYDKISNTIFAIQTKMEKAQRYAQEPERFTIEGNIATMQSTHDTRRLTFKQNLWHCSCDFFAHHHTCSHSMALTLLQK